MLLPRYWARARTTDARGASDESTVAYGSSDLSMADARLDAETRARRVLEWLRGGRRHPHPSRYGYADERPLREEIVRRIEAEGEISAAITRNAYGALILNTELAMFIDVDRATPPGLVGRLLGRATNDGLRRLRDELSATPGLAARVYRTANGWRALVTSQPVEPAAPETAALLERCGCDPRYRALCRVQRCFRARLTPKPWRCALRAPPVQFPFDGAADEARMREWIALYERATADYAVCELVETVGADAVDPAVAPILHEHDAACVRPGRPLA